MTTQEQCKKITESYAALESEALATIKEIVKKVGGRIEFDFKGCDAPSICSSQFKEDLADCYVKAVEVVNDVLYADLHSYYENADINGINLSNERVSWCCLLIGMMPHIVFID